MDQSPEGTFETRVCKPRWQRSRLLKGARKDSERKERIVYVFMSQSPVPVQWNRYQSDDKTRKCGLASMNLKSIGSIVGVCNECGSRLKHLAWRTSDPCSGPRGAVCKAAIS